MSIRTLFLLVTLGAATLGFGQSTPPKVELVLPKDAVIGKPLKATLRVTFEPGLHGYQNPPTKDYMIPVKVESAVKDITLKPTYPSGMVKDFAGVATAVYEGTVEIPILITLPKKLGAAQLKINFSYQQCNAEACFPPDTISVMAKINVKKAAKS